LIFNSAFRIRIRNRRRRNNST